MGRLLACLVVVALVGAGAAFAGRGDPQEKLTAADNARAGSMLLKKSDLGPGFTAIRAPQSGSSYCRALDESDLTLTGKAVSPNFQAAIFEVASYADVYESLADANAAWRRGTSPAGQACLRELVRRDVVGPYARFVSFTKTALPRVAKDSMASRLVAERDGVKIFVDFIWLHHSRASAGLAFASAYAPVPREAQIRHARLVSGRMATAMRG